MKPRGARGRLFGWVMQLLNMTAYKWAQARVREKAPQSILEIGFGTGKLAERCLRVDGVSLYAGVDPSPLMVETARGKLSGLTDAAIDLREATDAMLDWPEGSFDAVIAVHSFQFWENPAATLARIHAVLKPGGIFVLILRIHGKKPPKWLPNPCCHMGDERSAARKALSKAGFVITHDKRISTASYGLSSRRP